MAKLIKLTNSTSGYPILLNPDDISYVEDSLLYLRSQKILPVREDFETLEKLLLGRPKT